MPEGSFIVMMFCIALTASMFSILYTLRLALKYRRIKRDMRCIYRGVVHDIVSIIYDPNDWFKRSVRLRRDEFPYYFQVLISEIATVRSQHRIQANNRGGNHEGARYFR